MRVITALGRFRSSGLSAISFPAQGSLEPGLPIICGTAADLGRKLCRARAWQIGESPSRLKKLASENAPPEKEGRGYRRQTSNRLLHLIDWLGLFLESGRVPTRTCLVLGRFPRSVQATVTPPSTLTSDVYIDVTRRLSRTDQICVDLYSRCVWCVLFWKT